MLLAALPGVGRCHIDATRVSLSQLFLQADVVLLARIQGAGDREVSRGEGSAVTELVSASVIETFKGEAGEKVSVFLDAHGPAHYSPGDTAVLFLEEPWAEHPLADAVAAGEIDFFSRQVRTTEHRVNPENEADYRWVLGHYAAHWQRHQACVVDGSASADVFGSGSGTSAASLDPEPVSPVALDDLLLRMLTSNDPSLVDSALLDWRNAGAAVSFGPGEVEQLLVVVHDPAGALNLRLSILRAMASQALVGPAAWDDLFAAADRGDEIAVIRSTHGFEDRHFQPLLHRFLSGNDPGVAAVAARALGHPSYAGSEVELEKALDGDNLQLSYAAIAGLTGIGSERSDAVLNRAREEHPNPRVRRMVTARLQARG